MQIKWIALGVTLALATSCTAPSSAPGNSQNPYPPAAADRCSGARDDATVAQVLKRDQSRLDALHAMGLGNDDLCTISPKVLGQALRKSGDGQAKAARTARIDGYYRWQRDIARSRDGRVDPLARVAAIQQREADLRKASDAGVLSGSWTALGPTNIPGRVRAVQINPNNSQQIWFGAVDGGVFMTTNGGASWSASSGFSGNIAVTSLALNPENLAIMYAATGEGFNNLDAIAGAGIFKSQDGGATWTQLPATNPALNSDFLYVNRLAMQPGNPNQILAATAFGSIYLTTNSGQSWTKTFALPSGTRSLQVLYDPNNANNAVAGFDNGKIAYSRDGGLTWTAVTVTNIGTASGRVEMAYAKANPGLILAGVDKDNGQVWSSTNGGVSWTLLSTPRQFNGGAGSQGWYDNTVWIDPTNSANVVIGGVDLFRSTNGGSSFTKISNWAIWPNSAHADNHSITAMPTYNGTTDLRVVVSNDGGLWLANNILTVSQAKNGGWTSINQGMSTYQLYHAAGVANAPYLNNTMLFAGGAQDNGVAGTLGTSGQWSMLQGGDGGMVAIDATSSTPYIYSEYVQGEPQVNTSVSESSAQNLCGNLTEGSCVGMANAAWVAPLMLDPSFSQRLVLGMESLWYSNNPRAGSSGIQWTQVTSPATAGSIMTAMAMTPLLPGYVLFGTNNGAVWAGTGVFNNANGEPPQWRQVIQGQTNGSMVTSITIDPNNIDTIYVTTGGYGQAGNLVMSTNAGQNWTDISGGLPQVPVLTFTRHPSNPQWFYAGTAVGLYTSINGGQSWNTTNDGPGNIAVSHVSFIPGTTNLLAATHGRGLFMQATSYTPAQTPATGLYTDSAASGRQYLFERAPTANVYLAVLAWTPTGSPTWVTGLNPMPPGSTGVSMTLNSYNANVTPTAVAQAALGFSSRTSGTLFIAGGSTLTLNATNFGSGAQLTGAPQNGWWYMPFVYGGIGIFVQSQGNVLTLAYLTYDSNGQPIWYMAQGPMTSTRLFEGVLSLCTGGPTLVSDAGGAISCTSAGTISVTFNSQNTATMVVGSNSYILTKWSF